MGLLYSDEPPSQVGYYWERRASGERVIEVTAAHLGSNILKRWCDRKAESIAMADGEQLTKLLALPDANWRIEFAGPIEQPGN